MADVHHELDLPGGAVRFRFAGHSDRGVVRRINEDSFLATFPFFVVADGMGGHAHGERASLAAVTAFSGAADVAGPLDPTSVLATIRDANRAVRAVQDGADAPAMSGTTLAGVAFVEASEGGDHRWMIFNIGDSRVYSWDGRTLLQLSVDHSAVQELVDEGVITRLEADHHPERNVVTRALGASDEVDPDVWLFPAHDHQTFLLCSDGLSKELDDDEIARIIVFHAAEASRGSDGLPLTLAERLVNAAIAAGGSDNVTVVVVESDFAGVVTAGDETVDREAMPGFLEETRPRG